MPHESRATLLRVIATRVACLAALTACASSDSNADLPPSTHVWEQPLLPYNTLPVTWVVTIDDRDDPEAAQLRARMKEGFSSYLRDLLANRTVVQHDADQWYGVELRMVVAHPSVGAWTGPDDDPALRWSTTDANEEGARSFADAFARAVDASIAPAGSSYRLLETYRRTGRLVTRCDPPQDGREARLSESAGAGFPFVRLLVATARDDESPDAPESYRIDDDSRCEGTYRSETSTYGPAVPDGALCKSSIASTWRLARWDPFMIPVSVDAMCSAYAVPSAWFDTRLYGDLYPRCLSRAIAVGSDGLALCAIEVTNEENDCPASRGWFDSTGSVAPPKEPRRVCEVRQLEGDAGALCRSGADCSNCPSGFCRLDRTPEGCRAGTFPTQLRFIGGALSGRFEGRIRCVLAD